ncbi:MAG: hypothetical protein WCH99_16440 [Verrucomicrobiota bacterium]
MENEKRSICENVAELGQHKKNCQMSIVRKLPPMLPPSGRKVWPERSGESEAQDELAVKVSGAGYERFDWLLSYGTADGVTRLCRIMAKGRTALTALFYDGTVATMCREMTIYDARERFRTLIRHKTALFYNENSARYTE